MAQLQRSIKISAMDLVSDAMLTATADAACEAVIITVLSLREGFEVLAQRGMSAFFVAAVF